MINKKRIKLSILDQSPIRQGTNARQALAESVKLAKMADRMGYTRFWVSEHHNIGSLAGSAPEVLIAHLAGNTSRIRIGSGGIMLPNHSALKVAENFKVLENLFPGRIDLGVGRAPGGDRLTSHILNPSNNFDPQDYIKQIIDLQAFLSDTALKGSIQEKVKAIPQSDSIPPLWMLTSSGESGLIAAHFGLALSYAQFINPIGGPQAIANYKDRFKPSAYQKEPETNLSIFVFCAETEEKANELQSVMDYRLLTLDKGNIDSKATYQDIKDIKYSEHELARITFNRGRMIAGTPNQAKKEIENLADKNEVQEIMVVTITEYFEDRIKSYKLLAEAFQLPKLEETLV
ncbi:LLM class flavin-dependent oxidoreductase [soil metagenome]